ncbi:MAG TPA: RluA family pseudouridine synthase [Microthrixaceae bacterium]|nr:RluA family pseudouridine synthase [Microthrixaceae bacterium]
MTSEVVPAALEGERVDRVVSMITGCSRSEAATVVGDGHVLVDGRAVTKVSIKVHEGQTIEVAVDPVRPPVIPGPDASVPVEVLFADDDVIVIDKPPGLVVHPGAGHQGATLVHGLLARFPELEGVGGDPERPGIVHRLDKGTSGLLVVARTDDAHDALVAQLSTHEVERTYLALTWGAFETKLGTIDAPVGRSRRDPLKMTVTASGRPSRTHYEVLEAFSDPVTTLLRCQLETGRTHQIRVHLRSLGRPVVGDDLYGGVRPGLVSPRPFLHATRLAFEHPANGEVLTFESPLPADLRTVLEELAPAV